MRREDVRRMADVAEALEDEIHALTVLDPYDPQITLLQERLESTLSDLYRSAPRGV